MSFIDLRLRHLYYSHMIFRTILIVLITSTISACGHLRAPNSQKPVVVEPAPQNTIEPSIELEDINTQQTPNGQPISDGPDLVQDSTPNNAIEDDLLERIRNGFAFPDFNSKHTKRYEKWNSQHPTYLKNLFERATPFLFYIVEEIEKRGLPTEIALLPAIESAYKPNAVSRSNAGGLWQFIPSTGKGFGLRQDWWYDGRRDVIASTNAALDYLEQLNTAFDGDWFNTLAAYNAGPGTLQRAIKANKRKRKGTNYQRLKLRKETVNYVPKLIALKNIVNNPQRYNVSLPKISNQPWFSVVNLPGQIDLHDFSAKANIELAVLQHLNAGFRRWASSPEGPHRLVVPNAKLDATNQALASIKSAPTINYQNHNIKRGDSLSSIARQYHVSISALKNVNRLSGSFIKEGRNLLIPIPVKTPVTTSAATLSSGTANYSQPAKPTRVHRVVAGDTLWSIAKRYQVKVAELVSWNQISNTHILSLNQILKVFPN